MLLEEPRTYLRRFAVFLIVVVLNLLTVGIMLSVVHVPSGVKDAVRVMVWLVASVVFQFGLAAELAFLWCLKEYDLAEEVIANRWKFQLLGVWLMVSLAALVVYGPPYTLAMWGVQFGVSVAYFVRRALRVLGLVRLRRAAQLGEST